MSSGTNTYCARREEEKFWRCKVNGNLGAEHMVNTRAGSNFRYLGQTQYFPQLATEGS
jgi:hypothetical protein